MQTDQPFSPEDGSVYRGSIVDQAFTVLPEGGCRAILTVSLKGRLKNGKVAADGVEECPQVERDVWITFDSEEDWKLERAISDLERLGFKDDDISRLHCDHPEAVSLIGKEVHVRCKAGKFEYWNLAWPQVKATSAEVKEAREAAARNRATIAQVRSRMRQERSGRRMAPDNSFTGEERREPGY